MPVQYELPRYSVQTQDESPPFRSSPPASEGSLPQGGWSAWPVAQMQAARRLLQIAGSIWTPRVAPEPGTAHPGGGGANRVLPAPFLRCVGASFNLDAFVLNGGLSAAVIVGCGFLGMASQQVGEGDGFGVFRRATRPILMVGLPGSIAVGVSAFLTSADNMKWLNLGLAIFSTLSISAAAGSIAAQPVQIGQNGGSVMLIVGTALATGLVVGVVSARTSHTIWAAR